MKPPKLFFATVFSIIVLESKSQATAPRIEIVEPTIEHEATSIWRTINDIIFLEKEGYKIELPENSSIDSLIMKSRNGTFGRNDFSTIYKLVENNVFNHKNYERAIQKVNDQTDLINQLIYVIDSQKAEWDWNFQMFDKYIVLFTLYGTGGSYDPDEGTITLLTTKKGEFMNYENPTNTIIHEITHIGMEYSLVHKYNLPHGLKERVVDTFVYLMFKEKLPEYRVQNMGNPEIDEYLKTRADIGSLDRIISEFVNE